MRETMVHYGVFGEGMGHCSRALTVAPLLVDAGFRVKLFSSGRAAEELSARLQGCECVEIPGHRFAYRKNRLSWARTGLGYLGMVGWGHSAWRTCRRSAVRDRPVVCLSDYEPFVAWSARRGGVPLIAFDHQQVVSECEFDRALVRGRFLGPVLVANRLTYPRPSMRIITSFFHPKLRGRGGAAERHLVGPVLRQEVLDRRPCEGRHVLVYQTSASLNWLDSILDALPGEKRVYGGGVRAREGVEVKAFDDKSFLEDLASCRFAVVNGGHTTICEALQLGKPLICLPVRGQVEQELNALHVEKMGFGRAYWPRPGAVPDFSAFLGREDEIRRAIAARRLPPGNQRVADLVRRAVAGRLSEPAGATGGCEGEEA